MIYYKKGIKENILILILPLRSLCLCGKFSFISWLFLIINLSMLTLLMTYPNPAFCQEIVTLNDSCGEYPLGFSLKLLEDKERRLTINDIIKPENSSRFKQSTTLNPNPGLTSSAIWTRFTIKNESNEDKWLLEISNAPISDIDLYIPNGLNGFNVKRSGYRQPINIRDIKHRFFIFKIPISKDEIKTFYLRIVSKDAINLPMYIETENVLAEKDYQRQYFIGIYYGIISVMLLYNLFIYLSLRDLSYLYYVLYFGSFLMVQSYIDGTLYGYGWRELTGLGIKGECFFAGLVMIFGIAFARTFLQTKQYARNTDKIIKILLIFSYIYTILTFILSPYIMLNVLSILGLIIIFICLYAAAICLYRGYRPARFYLLASIMFLSGISLKLLANLSIIPMDFLATHGMHIGSGLDVTLISIALADRISILRHDKESAEQQTKLLNIQLEHKVLERTQELMESEEKFKAMFEYSNDGIDFVDPENEQIILCNQRFQDMLGYSRDEIKGLSIKNIHPKQDWEWISEKFKKAMQQQFAVTENIPVIKKDGNVFLVDINSYLCKSVRHPFIVGQFKDVTERNAAQRVLKQHKLLFDYAGYGIYGVDLSGCITFINIAATKMIEWDREDLIGKILHNTISIGHNKNPYPIEDCPINQALKEGKTIVVNDEIFAKKDGSSFPVDYTITPIKNEGGEIEGAVVVFKDITERKQFEERLNKSMQYSLNIINSSMDMIIATDSEGKIFEFNIAAQRLFQYRKEEIVGKNLSYLFLPMENSINIYDETIQRGSFSDETICVCKDGTEFVSAVSFSVMYDSNDNIYGLVGILRDITEKKIMEQRQNRLFDELKIINEQLKNSQTQLVQSEKMASLGQLVAGVAHEINTPIGISLTTSSHLITLTKDIKSSLENNSLKRSMFNEYLNDFEQGNDLILRNLKRTADLIKSFKMVAADQTSQEIRRFNLKTYLEDIILSLRPKLKRTSHIVEIQCPSDIDIESNPGAFAQIITNLIMNSLLHAFDEAKSGHITISCEISNNKLVMIYSDNGKGIPEEHLAKIFDPFFTTRRNSGGTGLGLNIVFNIVNQNLKGKIRCESLIGHGTSFILELPVNLDNDLIKVNGEQ